MLATARSRAKPGYQGPYYGLATDIDAQQLGPGYARKAHNVLLNRGRIRPRTPWREIRGRTGVGRLTPPDQLGIQSILAMHHLYNSTSGNLAVSTVLFIVRGGLWAAEPDTPGSTREQPVLLKAGDFSRGAQFLPVGKWVYVLSPTDPIYKTDGAVVLHAGITPPLSSDFSYTLITTGEGASAPTVRYYVTYASQDKTIESNRTFVAEQGGLANLSGIRVTFSRPIPRFPGDQAYWVRLYRQNVYPGGMIGARLVAETPLAAGQTDVLFAGTEDSITASAISGETIGPMAPVRNGVPPVGASCGDIYDERFWINDPARTNAVRFSERGGYEHFADEDFLVLTGAENEHVGGIKEYGGALYVGKAPGVWQISGQVETPTNLDIAFGAGALASTALVQRTRSEGGPCNRAGNGFVVAGSPARMFFGNIQGFWAFDGVDAVQVSDVSATLWRQFALQEDRYPGFTYGCDQLEGVLYIATTVRGEGWEPKPTASEDQHLLHPGVADDRFRPPTFALIYDLKPGGGFATCGGRDYGTRFGDPQSQPVFFNPYGPAWLDPTCFATGITKSGQDFLFFQKGDRPVLVGTSGGAILFVDPSDASDAVVPGWEYETGDLNITDGREAHLYFLTMLLAGTRSPPPLNPEPDPENPLVTLSVLRYSGDLNPANDRSFVLGPQKFVRIPVGAKFDQMTLRLRCPASSGYRRDRGVVGWELHMENQGEP